MIAPPSWCLWLLLGVNFGHLATVFGLMIAGGFADARSRWRERRRAVSP